VPHAEISGDRIALQTVWTEKDLVKLVPGSRWDHDGRVWTVPLSWAACLQLRGVFGAAFTVGPELQAWSWSEYTNRVTPAVELRSQLASTGPALPAELADLYDFQTCGVRFMDVAGDALLSDEVGTGKTIQMLSVLRLHELTAAHADGGEDAGALPALVVCPNSVKTGWARQAERWLPGVTPYVVRGGAAARKKILESAKGDPSALVIVNIEAVRLLSRVASFGSIRLKRCRECDPRNGEEKITSSRCEVHHKELNDFGFRTVIVDEAHRIKQPQSIQARAVWAVGHDPSVHRRWALTGTPIANHVGDLWSIMHFLKPDEYPTKSAFVDRYALQAWNPFGGLDIVGVNPQTRDEFFKILDPRFRRTLKAQVLDQLPPVVREERYVEMTPRQKKAYAELESQLITRLADGQLLVARNNLVRATRLLQLASSYATVEYVIEPCRGLDLSAPGGHCRSCETYVTTPVEDDPTRHVRTVVKLTEPSPKLDALEEMLDELGDKPVVIAAESRQLIDLAAARMDRRGESYGMITGPRSEYERQRDLDRFRRGELRAMLITSGAGGEGVDGLQYADTLIVLQRSWKMITNVQLDGRMHRIGSERHESVTIIEIICEDSIEQTVLYPRFAVKLARLEEITRDRARLAALGAPTHHLDELESAILASDLGAPDDTSSFTSYDGEVLG